MSRKSFRPTARPTGEARRPAEALEAAFLDQSAPARDWDHAPQSLPEQPDVPPMPKQPPQVSLSELLTEYGGTRGLAAAVGISQRQVERWQSGTADPARSRRATRAAFGQVRDEVAARRLAQQRRRTRRERKSIRDRQRDQRRQIGTSEWGGIVERLGGTAATAAAVGRSPRTVERWVTGQAHPNVVDQQRLAAADHRTRVRSAFGLKYWRPPQAPEPGGAPAGTEPRHEPEPDDAQVGIPGEPQGSVYVRASGFVHVEGYYQYQRQVGVAGLGPDGMHELPPEVAADMVENLAAGDRDAALHTLQGHLSTGYAQCDGYDPDGSLGWHFQELDTFQLTQLGTVD